MKKSITAIAVIAAIAASCTKTEVVPNAQSEENVIGFATYANGTKATNEVSNTNIKTSGNAFGVAGFATTGGTAVMNANTQISYTTAWGYANSTDLAFWPAGEVAFYAYYPYASTGVTTQSTLPANASDAVVSFAVDGTKDVLLAYKAQAKTAGTTVTLPFNHIYSKIKEVSLTVVPTSMKVTVTNVEICNTKTAGTVALNKDGSHTLSNTATARSVAYSGSAITSTSGTVKFFDTDKDAYIFPVATTEVWDGVAGSASSNAAANKVCLKLTAKVEMGGTTVHDGAIYVPICGTATDKSTAYALTAAKRYIINVTMQKGIGYDADGNPLLTAIAFDTTVTDWADDVTVNVTL